MALKVEQVQNGATKLVGIVPDKGSISLHSPAGLTVVYFEQHVPPRAQLREEGKVGHPLAQVSLPEIDQTVILFSFEGSILQVTRVV